MKTIEQHIKQGSKDYYDKFYVPCNEESCLTTSAIINSVTKKDEKKNMNNTKALIMFIVLAIVLLTGIGLLPG